MKLCLMLKNIYIVTSNDAPFLPYILKWQYVEINE